MAIIKRLTKGSKLTHAELDGNFTHFETVVADLEKKRTVKTISNTTQYTLVAADFTDFILDFTANLGETVSVVLNTGVAPVGGLVQIVSSGNNFLVPTAGTGVTLKKPAETNLKTVGANSWLSIVPFSTTETFGVNGNLESTATSTATFTAITAGQYGPHPAFATQEEVNAYVLARLAYEYTLTLTAPTEGQSFNVGDIITFSSTITAK